jgi:hypothetical protein
MRRSWGLREVGGRVSEVEQDVEELDDVTWRPMYRELCRRGIIDLPKLRYRV